MDRKGLIIGYGNPLRSDDGAGQKVAEQIAKLNLVNTLSVHQLTPELSEDIAACDWVYFVDAASLSNDKIQLQPLQPLDIPLTHHADPRSLLFLTKTLYNKTPEAYLLLIPAVNFELGETFSSITQTGIHQAIIYLSRQVKLSVE